MSPLLSWADEVAALRARHPAFVLGERVVVLHGPCTGKVGIVHRVLPVTGEPWLIRDELVLNIPQAWVRMLMPLSVHLQTYGGPEGGRMLRLDATQCECVS